MLMFTPFALIHGPNIPGSYAVLLFTASHFTSITSHIHNWMLFLLWLRLFILSGVISPLISSSILGTYQPGELKLNIQKTKIMASGPITSREIDWEAVETVSDFIFGAPKSLQMLIAAIKLKAAYSLKGKL